MDWSGLCCMQALHLRKQLELVCSYSLGSFSSEKFAAFGLALDAGLGIEVSSLRAFCALPVREKV